MSEFDWGRARQRRAADIDSATGANPNTHKSKAGVYPNSRTPWRRHQLLVNPDSSDSHGQKGSGGVEGETRDSDSSPRQYLGDTKRQNLNPRLIQKQYVKKENRLSKKQRTISVINLTDFVSLKDKDPESAKITACEDAGSYNWLNATVPTILIPGSPPIWTPVNEPHRLEEDQGSYPLDQNSLRWPKHPIEPTIRAAFDLNPNLKPEEIDVVTCAGILGNLFKFASSFPWSFRFDLEKVGNTVFMVRNEGKGVIKGIHGCGHTFRAKNTSWDPSVKESVSHQRVLRYKFGGLNFLLRFEADGFLPDLVQQEKDPFVIVGHHTAATKSDPMAETLELKIISGQLELPDEQKKLRIIRPISFIPHGALFELKTRNMSNEIDMSIQFPRLWARQIKNFILAYHQDGKFGKDITIQNVVAGVKNWEVENQSTLSLVAAILNKLIAEVNNSAHGKLEVSRHKSGPLILRVQRGLNRDVLPENLKAKWANNNSADKQEDNDSSYDNEEWDLINHNEW